MTKMVPLAKAVQPIGVQLREWRQRRRLSQLELACEADISSRHLSFLETGRSRPSRDMILHLAEQLEIPIRERNVLLVAGGYAPMFPERSLDDPSLNVARHAVDLVLEGQKPYPAFAIDRHWNVVASNLALPELYVGVAAHLLQPPINVLRLSLHPQGLTPRIANLPEWRAHLLARLRRQIDLTADRVLVDLMREALDYPMPPGTVPFRGIAEQDALLMPFKIVSEAGLLSLFTTTTVFGTPIDITLSELTLEMFFPADAETAQAVRRLAGDSVPQPHAEAAE
jgi:transcriptional regulator with XRE-family HTH domain